MTETLIPEIDEAKAEIEALSLRTQLFIDGEFRDAAGGGRFTTENPATGRPIAEVARAARPMWTRPSRRRAGPPTMVAGRASTRRTASGSWSGGRT